MDDEARVDEWVLAHEMLEDQRLILSNPLSADDLIRKIACAARQASHEDEFFLCWEASTKHPGQARVSGVFRCPEDVFDQFFNGRTGYRAHYYLGPDVGEAYNRNVLDQLADEEVSVSGKRWASRARTPARTRASRRRPP